MCMQLMDQFTMVNGDKIRSMEKVLYIGLLVRVMKVTLKMELSKVLEYLGGRQAKYTRVNLMMVLKKEQVR